MKNLLLALALLLTSGCFSQTKINIKLKKQLDSIMILDQKYREDLSILRTNTDTATTTFFSKALDISEKNLVQELSKRQHLIDSTNTVFIEHIFQQYGYPGKSLVDTPTNETAFYVIQHSSKIPKYLNLIKEAAQKNELPFPLAAMMEDRYLVYQGKEQIYGTQGTTSLLKNGKIENFIWPIQNPKQVNQLRKQAGFKQTVEVYAKRFNIVYRIIKLSEIP